MKRLFVVLTPERSWGAEVSMTTLRVVAGLSMALAHGWKKIPPADGFVGHLAGMGFPAPHVFAWLAALAEFGGGLLLAVGLLTRFAAISVAGTMFVAAFVAHAADPFGKKEMALLYFVIAFVFAIRGSGRISADRFLA